MDKYIGENIKKARILAGFTQEKLAERIDVSLSVISRLETGRTMVSVEKLVRISRVLNVPVGAFFERDPLSGTQAKNSGSTSPSDSHVPHLLETAPPYPDPTDEELYRLIQQLPDKAKQYFKNSLRCYLEIF